MVATATKSRHLGLLCELDISGCLLACTVIFILVSLLHYILYKTGGEAREGDKSYGYRRVHTRRIASVGDSNLLQYSSAHIRARNQKFRSIYYSVSVTAHEGRSLSGTGAGTPMSTVL